MSRSFSATSRAAVELRQYTNEVYRNGTSNISKTWNLLS